MSESWVINASPVILLAKAGLMERVPSLADRFIVPQAVVEEILRVCDDAPSRWLTTVGKQYVRPAVTELAALTDAEIGPGERAVISWAAAQRGFVAVLDDREARAIAQRLGIRVIGTVGVVLRLKKAGYISEVKSHLLRIKNEGGYIGDELLREALRSAGEKP